MKNIMQEGKSLTVAPPFAVASGGGCKSGLIFGVAQGAAASGADVVILTQGVVDLAKLSANTFAAGAAVYWDDAAKTCTNTSSGNTKIGVAVAAAGNPSATVRTRLKGTF